MLGTTFKDSRTRSQSLASDLDNGEAPWATDDAVEKVLALAAMAYSIGDIRAASSTAGVEHRTQ